MLSLKQMIQRLCDVWRRIEKQMHYIQIQWLFSFCMLFFFILFFSVFLFLSSFLCTCQCFFFIPHVQCTTIKMKTIITNMIHSHVPFHLKWLLFSFFFLLLFISSVIRWSYFSSLISRVSLSFSHVNVFHGIS